MDLRKIYLDFSAKHFDLYPIKDALYSGGYCYKPLIDVAVFRPFPAGVNLSELVTNMFGKKYDRGKPLDQLGIETTIQKEIANDEELIKIYL